MIEFNKNIKNYIVRVHIIIVTNDAECMYNVF